MGGHSLMGMIIRKTVTIFNQTKAQVYVAWFAIDICLFITPFIFTSHLSALIDDW